MTKQEFHFGIIGCGAIAGVHAQAIAAMEDAHLESVCDSDPDRAKAFAQDQGCRWHTTRRRCWQIRRSRSSVFAFPAVCMPIMRCWQPRRESTS